MPSPTPLPTAILHARGSWRANTRRNEPTLAAGAPTRPDHLLIREEAKQIWDALMPILESMGIVTQADGPMLTRYCTLYARWIEAEKFLKERGSSSYPIKNADGRIVGTKVFPEAGLAIQLSESLRRIEAEFGLSPSARTRINMEMAVGRAAVRIASREESKNEVNAAEPEFTADDFFS